MIELNTESFDFVKGSMVGLKTVKDTLYLDNLDTLVLYVEWNDLTKLDYILLNTDNKEVFDNIVVNNFKETMSKKWLHFVMKKLIEAGKEDFVLSLKTLEEQSYRYLMDEFLRNDFIVEDKNARKIKHFLKNNYDYSFNGNVHLTILNNGMRQGLFEDAVSQTISYLLRVFADNSKDMTVDDIFNMVEEYRDNVIFELMSKHNF